jgi:hypothetical protein
MDGDIGGWFGTRPAEIEKATIVVSCATTVLDNPALAGIVHLRLLLEFCYMFCHFS